MSLALPLRSQAEALVDAAQCRDEQARAAFASLLALEFVGPDDLAREMLVVTRLSCAASEHAPPISARAVGEFLQKHGPGVPERYDEFVSLHNRLVQWALRQREVACCVRRPCQHEAAVERDGDEPDGPRSLSPTSLRFHRPARISVSTDTDTDTDTDPLPLKAPSLKSPSPTRPWLRVDPLLVVVSPRDAPGKRLCHPPWPPASPHPPLPSRRPTAALRRAVATASPPNPHIHSTPPRSISL